MAPGSIQLSPATTPRDPPWCFLLSGSFLDISTSWIKLHIFFLDVSFDSDLKTKGLYQKVAMFFGFFRNTLRDQKKKRETAATCQQRGPGKSARWAWNGFSTGTHGTLLSNICAAFDLELKNKTTAVWKNQQKKTLIFGDGVGTFRDPLPSVINQEYFNNQSTQKRLSISRLISTTNPTTGTSTSAVRVCRFQCSSYQGPKVFPRHPPRDAPPDLPRICQVNVFFGVSQNFLQVNWEGCLLFWEELNSIYCNFWQNLYA